MLGINEVVAVLVVVVAMLIMAMSHTVRDLNELSHRVCSLRIWRKKRKLSKKFSRKSMLARVRSEGQDDDDDEDPEKE